MQGCVKKRWHSQHSPFEKWVYCTVAMMIVAITVVAFIMQGCRGQLETSSFSSPSSGARFCLVLGSGPLSQTKQASATEVISSSPGRNAGTLDESTDSGKDATNRAVARSLGLAVTTSSATDLDRLIQALISAAPEGEGRKAAPGGLTDPPGSYSTTMIVTAYCPLECCCGQHADSFTASGHRIRPGAGEKFVAAPKEYSFGTIFDVPGYGNVGCLDRGGAIKDNKLDVYFDTHTEAAGWGIKELIVKVTAAQDAGSDSAHGGARL